VERETEFLLRRAHEEALKAIRSDQPEAADVHEAMAVSYSVKAAELLADPHALAVEPEVSPEARSRARN
jgi:hypothetical protein